MLALMGLMAVPEDSSARLRANALKRIIELVDDEHRRFLLAECVQTYWKLNDEQQQEFENLVEAPELEEVKTMAVTWFEQGVEEGLQRGIRRGREEGREEGFVRGERRAIRLAASARFGTLPANLVARLESIPADRLDELLQRLVLATSLAEFDEHLVALETRATDSNGAAEPSPNGN